MSSRSKRTSALVLAVVAVAGAALAGAAFDRDRGLPVPDARELGELEERWESLSEQQRDRFRSRYAELQGLEESAREDLAERIRRLDELARLVFRSLDESSQQRMLQLEAPKRRELLREMAIDEARAMGQRVLESLSDEDRARLEAATEADRLRFFVEFRRRQDQRLEASMDRVARELGMGEEELARFDGLLPDQRRARFLDMVKRRTLRLVEQRGLPATISAERWGHASALEPREFYLMLLRLQDHADLRLPLGPGARAEPSPWARVRRLIRGDVEPETRLALAELSGTERRAALRRARRERTTEYLRANELLPAGDMAALEAASDAAFFGLVREHLRDRR